MKQFIDRFFPYQMVKLILKKSTSSLESSTPRISSFIDNTEKGALKEQLLGYLNYFAANDETSLLHQEKYAEILQKVKNNALHPPRLLVKPSTIPLAGNGVYSSIPIDSRQVVCIYPGTLYMPWDPVFFASLHNRYMFRLSDGSFIDGKKTALSRAIYLSCRSQGHLGFFESCDETWLHSNPPASSLTSCTQVTPSQFAIGQIVNHATRQSLANLAYIEIVLQDFQIPIYLRPYLPNVLYSFSSSSVSTSMRVIVLVATRNIEEGEELFTIYFE